MLFVLKPLRVAFRVLGFLVLIGFVYWAVVLVIVWNASTNDDRSSTDAIIVMGAAQYNGTPSPVLQARLDHAIELWKANVAPVIVVTGGKQLQDKFTEAQAGAKYLIQRGVPDTAILREVDGKSSWQSLQASARFLKADNRKRVTLVSDAYHSARIVDIADDSGLDAVTSPTRFVSGSKQLPYLLKESVRVAGGRIFGYGRLDRHQRVGELVPGLAIMALPIRRVRRRWQIPIRG